MSMLTFVFTIIRPIIFSAIQKVSFPKSRNFLQSRTFSQWSKFSTVKEVPHSQELFPQSKNFSKIKKIFHNQVNFLQSSIFSTKNFSAVVEVFHSQNFPHKKFTWSKKFSTNKVFPKIFSLIKEVLHKQRVSDCPKKANAKNVL